MGNKNEDQTYVGEMSANEHHSTKGGSHFQYMKKGKREEEEEGGREIQILTLLHRCRYESFHQSCS